MAVLRTSSRWYSRGIAAFVVALVSSAGVAMVSDASPAFAAVADGVATASVRPVPGAVVRPFDPPAHRYGAGHRGVDLAAASGTPVRAVRRGQVTWSGRIDGTGWITLDHGGGLSTTYGDVETSLTIGADVRAGQMLGRLAPGRSHLDWGARWEHDGGRDYLDPMLLLADLRPVLVAPADSSADV